MNERTYERNDNEINTCGKEGADNQKPIPKELNEPTIKKKSTVYINHNPKQ